MNDVLFYSKSSRCEVVLHEHINHNCHLSRNVKRIRVQHDNVTTLNTMCIMTIQPTRIVIATTRLLLPHRLVYLHECNGQKLHSSVKL